MTRFVLRNTNKATWDEQGCDPALTGPEAPLHAQQGGPAGTVRDHLSPGHVSCFRWTA